MKKGNKVWSKFSSVFDSVQRILVCCESAPGSWGYFDRSLLMKQLDRCKKKINDSLIILENWVGVVWEGGWGVGFRVGWSLFSDAVIILPKVNEVEWKWLGVSGFSIRGVGGWGCWLCV